MFFQKACCLFGVFEITSRIRCKEVRLYPHTAFCVYLVRFASFRFDLFDFDASVASTKTSFSIRLDIFLGLYGEHTAVLCCSASRIIPIPPRHKGPRGAIPPPLRVACGTICIPLRMASGPSSSPHNGRRSIGHRRQIKYNRGAKNISTCGGLTSPHMYHTPREYPCYFLFLTPIKRPGTLELQAGR